MSEIDAHLITDEADLRSRFGERHPLAVLKAHPHLDDNDKAFIARSPFLVLGTFHADGKADVSPRGDPAGFVKVLSDTQIAIPDRPGNNRLDSLSNILSNPSVALIFMVPGFEDTLRVNGRAKITTAPGLLDEMKVRDKAPGLAIVVDVAEVFLHCAKAFKRSRLWDPASLQDRRELPSLAAMVLEVAGNGRPTPEAVAEADARVEEAYRERLY